MQEKSDNNKTVFLEKYNYYFGASKLARQNRTQKNLLMLIKTITASFFNIQHASNMHPTKTNFQNNLSINFQRVVTNENRERRASFVLCAQVRANAGTN